MALQNRLPGLWNREMAKPTSFAALRDEIDKVFSDFSRDLPMSLGNGTGFLPAMELVETDKSVTVSFELAGLDRDDISISAVDQTLTVSGEKKSETETKEGAYYRSERSFGAFSRAIALPFKIDPAKVDAHFEKGLLTITLEKPADYQSSAHKIAIH
jgi:HSP20 family protein